MLFRSVRNAFAAATSPGRCEVVLRNPTVIIDAAHNPHGAQSLKRTISEEFDFDYIIGVIAPMADKDVDGILEECETIMDRVVVTRNSSHRAAPVDTLRAEAIEVFGVDRVTSFDELEEAIKFAIAEAHNRNQTGIENCGVLIAGSVVTAGESRAIIRKLKGSN